MLRPRPVPRYTYDDYVALEATSDVKHEFLDGEIYAMAGGTEDHSALAAAVLRVLGNALAASPERRCRAHTSDLRVYVEAAGLATFPDGAVICGPLAQHPPSPRATALNPLVLVEVTSPASEAYDTTTKVDAYLTIPSLGAYVLLSHRERRVTVHHRAPDGGWATTVAIAGGRAPVACLGAELVVDELYAGSALP